LTAAAFGADDDYRPLPLNQVPPAVRDAVLKKFPGAKPQDAHQGIDENKKPFIDVHILAGNRKVWVTCDPSGAIRTIDREITLQELPNSVAAAAQRKYPKATVRLVNEISEGTSPVYDIALTVNKKAIIATFSSSGEFISETEDDP
jgi:hypothetical protein